MNCQGSEVTNHMRRYFFTIYTQSGFVYPNCETHMPSESDTEEDAAAQITRAWDKLVPQDKAVEIVQQPGEIVGLYTAEVITGPLLLRRNSGQKSYFPGMPT